VFLKIRRKQKIPTVMKSRVMPGSFKLSRKAAVILGEFEDYLDTGLFLDHRPLRLLISAASQRQALPESVRLYR